MRRLVLGGPLLALLLLATACTGRDAEPETGPAPVGESSTTTAFTDCAALTASAAAPGTPAGTAGASGATPAAGRSLPALDLPCFVGGGEVAVGELRGPAVLNLWASWCAPCRKELPAFQRLAERAGDRLRVVGVNSGDSRPAAQSIGEDFGLEFPNLYDRDKKLLTGLGGRAVLPVTLLVDADGRIRHRDETGALDDAELATLVRRHLGVAVPS
ncbi:TlpA disulfide reductase family protein [Plantactinospora veratri]|uniref:TlpA disulfide reductase family protein n=1 Tax=Plantactinospora veratri TaxID=1436122 RepID=A0ABU7SBY8_9ACTN